MPSAFPIQNGLKQGVLLSLLFSLVLEYAIRNVQGNQEGTRIEWGTSDSDLC